MALCEPLAAWTMHQPFGSIWFQILASATPAMPRDLKQLVKTPDLAELYADAFGKEEKLKQAHAHTHALHILIEIQHPTYLLVILDLDLAGWL